MGNKRIYEVAKDYGKPVNEVIDLLKKNNIEKTNFSAADDKAMSVIRKAYDKKPEPPKPAKTEKRDVSKPAAPARPQDTAKRNDNNMNRNNGQRNMQQNQQQN
ncbi:translation initiation factor IF-2 N-terminal domain-containing protein, partial [Phascolarctobacterium succinatutens]